MKRVLNIILPFCLCLLLGCTPKGSTDSQPGEAPAHIFLNGSYYTLDGRVTIIPDTFSFIGEVKFRSIGQADMEGNVYGSIYGNSSTPHLIYLLPSGQADSEAPEYEIYILDETWIPAADKFPHESSFSSN